jgi:hypothetical protein
MDQHKDNKAKDDKTKDPSVKEAKSQHDEQVLQCGGIPFDDATFDEGSADDYHNKGRFTCFNCDGQEDVSTSFFCPHCFSHLCKDCALGHLKGCKVKYSAQGRRLHPTTLCKHFFSGCHFGDNCRYSQVGNPEHSTKYGKKPTKGYSQCEAHDKRRDTKFMSWSTQTARWTCYVQKNPNPPTPPSAPPPKSIPACPRPQLVPN